MAAKKQVVTYIGLVDVRRITVEDWRRAGVESREPRTVTWSNDNKMTVDRSDLDFLTDDEFNRFIRQDGRFVVTDVDA